MGSQINYSNQKIRQLIRQDPVPSHIPIKGRTEFFLDKRENPRTLGNFKYFSGVYKL